MPDGWSWPFRCSSCGREYPREALPFRCAVCGGHYDLADPLRYAPILVPGLERYRNSFPLPPGARLLSLGEGGTPLVGQEIEGKRVFFKCEYLNPTGSFKDRGTAVLISALAAAQVREAIEDSSGNAGASFAAYAARAGIRAKVFMPDSASGPKRAQIEAYGAEVVSILGPRSEAAQAVVRAAEAGSVYASHAYLPQILAGMATFAFELVEQLGRAPAALLLPVGQGTLLLGAYLGFQALARQKLIQQLPQLIGVQARACAPLWAVHEAGMAGLGWVQEGQTLAEGIRILNPLRGDAVLAAVDATQGGIEVVEESEIPAGRRALAERGFFVEPTSAVIWSALLRRLPDLPEPIVAALTGSGYKSAWNGA